MLLLRAKFLEARELPAKDPYPPSTLVSVLLGTETLHLIARHELGDELAGVDPLAEVVFELRHRPLDLASASGGSLKGKAYRLSITRLIEVVEAVA